MSKWIKAIAIGALTAAAIWMTLGAEAMAADGCGLSWYRGPNGACHRVGSRLCSRQLSDAAAPASPNLHRLCFA